VYEKCLVFIAEKIMANYDLSAPKKATNVSVNSDLLRQAKELGVNVSALAERSLAAHIKEIKIARWQEENKAAIESYNAMIRKEGVPGRTTTLRLLNNMNKSTRKNTADMQAVA
jgi:antitoxin CcdA